MREFLTLSLKLFVITLVAGILLGIAYSLTKEPIERNRAEKDIAARREVLPEAENFEPVDINIFPGEIRPLEAFAGINGGAVVGYTFKLEAVGYAGTIPLTVGINTEGLIVAVSVGSNKETAGLGSKAAEPFFKNQYVGKQDGTLSVTKSLSPSPSEITAITGATITSRGITEGVNRAMECYYTISK